MNKPAALSSAQPAEADEGFTAFEFMAMIENGAFDDVRVELVDGVIYKMAPAYLDHASNNFAIARLLSVAFEGLPVIVATELAIEIGLKTTRGLDIAVVDERAPRRGAVPGSFIRLGVEISDTTLAMDLGIKALEYARASVQNYWVVDTVASIIHTMTGPGPDGFNLRDAVRFGETLLVPGTGESIIVPPSSSTR